MSDTFRLQGLDPSTELGRYFDDSKWWWHGLWDYVYSLCSDFLTKEDYVNGHRIEDGYIIEKKVSVMIADKLFQSIESGHCEKVEKKTTESLEQLPEKIDVDTGKPAKPAELMYPFTVDNVKTFAVFCESCGGFMFLKRKN